MRILVQRVLDEEEEQSGEAAVREDKRVERDDHDGEPGNGGFVGEVKARTDS